jgi:Dullard-like phosphatase family protein
MYSQLPSLSTPTSASHITSLRRSPKAFQSPKAALSYMYTNSGTSSHFISPKHAKLSKVAVSRSSSAFKLPTLKTLATLDEAPSLPTPKQVNFRVKSRSKPANSEATLFEKNYQLNVPISKHSVPRRPMAANKIDEADLKTSAGTGAENTPTQKDSEQQALSNHGFQSKLPKEHRRTDLSTTTYMEWDQTPSKIIVKRRANLSVKKKVSPAAPMPRPDDPDAEYFTSMVRACGRSHGQFCADEEAVPEAVREYLKWLESNFRTMQLMRYDYVVENPKPITYQRQHPHKKLLLLDLDETLIHCSGDLSLRSQFEMEIDFINHEGVPLRGLLNIRPHARQFLQNMSEHFEVVIFTASMKYYADRILRVLDPQRKFVSHVFYRESCARTKGDKLVKDLTAFTKVPVEDMILVDNNMYCIWPQPSNGVPIINFEFNQADRELEKLERFLVKLKSGKHTDKLHNQFKIEELISADSVQNYLSLFEC